MKTTANEVRFALIGTGTIAKKHAISIERLANAKLVGAFDSNPEVAQRFTESSGVPVFPSVEEMVEKADPQVLNIATPSGLHAQTILDLLDFQRHFVVEKPLALRLDQIDEILAECDRRGLRIFVVKQNRFNPPIRKLKEALDNGRCGTLVLGTVRIRWSRDQDYYDQKSWRGTWALDGGVLTNQASHHIDMLIWMMGDVESVMAKTATRLVDIEAEDTGVAILKFRNGALGVIEATTATRPKDLEGSISILGENAAVEVGGYFMNQLKVWNFAEPDDGDAEIWEKYAVVPDEVAWNYNEFFKDVIKSLSGGEQALIDGLEGRKSVELINALYESSETGKEVSLRFTPTRCRLGVTS